MSHEPVLIGGEWRPANATGSFHAENPTTVKPLPEEFPISSWADCDEALAAAAEAAGKLRHASPEQIATFLTGYARRIEARTVELVDTAHAETALPKTPRLAGVKRPRTTDQLRQAAAAVREGSWALPTIDSRLNIRSVLGPLGPALIFGPNNFPYALQRSRINPPTKKCVPLRLSVSSCFLQANLATCAIRSFSPLYNPSNSAKTRPACLAGISLL